MSGEGVVPGSILIHCGLHKTGTTAFQKLCWEQRGELRRHGVLWPESQFSGGHHRLAWKCLAGDHSDLRAVCQENEPSILISSEDLEYTLVEPSIASEMEDTISRESARQRRISWLFTIRRPSDYFWSILAEMAKHRVFLDPLACFDEAMRTGRLIVVRSGGYAEGPPTWGFVFDHQSHLDAFRAAVGGTVQVRPYEREALYPCASLLDDSVLPPDTVKFLEKSWENREEKVFNPRISNERKRYLEAMHVHSLLGGAVEMAFLSSLLEQREAVTEPLYSHISESLDNAFGQLHRQISPV